MDRSVLDSKALPVIYVFLGSLFTILLRHGHLSSCICDCILVPVLKPCKDPTNGDNYRPIAFASTLSKALELCILLQFKDYFNTTDFQFGFKPAPSTSFCTGIVKSVIIISLYPT